MGIYDKLSELDTKKEKKDELLTSKQVSNKVSKQVITQASKEEVKKESIEERLLASLQNPNLKANTFRYTQEELDFIRDIVYEAETKHRVKLDKNDIARLGLGWLMEDWKER